MPRLSSRLAAVAVRGLAGALLIAVAAPPARATEEPDYRVVRQLPGVELREYAGHAVAEVVVPGPADDAGNQAFPILAGYLFGRNQGQRKLEMTAPVTQSPASAPRTPAMTAPVTQAVAPGGFLVQFVLPKGVTAANAPVPLDPQVRLRDVPSHTVAAIRYSGFWSTSNFDEHLALLQAALRTAGLAWTGEPVYARYNPPFTPWFLRRNEIWLTLASTPGVHGVAFATDLGKGYASNGRTNDVTVVDAAQARMDGAAWSANGQDGTISETEARSGRFETVAKIPSEPGARTIAADPSTHRLYLPTATLLPAAPGERRAAVPGSFHVLVLEAHPR